jgi:hypothetical protein
VALLNRLLSIRQLIPRTFGKALLIVSASLASGVCGALAGALILSIAEGSWLRLVAGGLASMIVSAALLYRMTPGLRGEVRALITWKAID